MISRVTQTAQNVHEYLDTHFEHLLADRGFTFRRQEVRTIPPGLSLDSLTSAFGTKLGDVLYTNQFHDTIWQHANGSLVMLALAPNGGLTAEVASSNLTLRNAVCEELNCLLPPRVVPPDREEVMVSFWTLGNQGARAIERTVAIAPWTKVEQNYTPQTHATLTKLMSEFHPTKAGQLVLWYGMPGTGKTHALRALAWEWRKWATCHYITDPEVFFGNANYMLDVLLMRDSGAYIDEDDTPAIQNDGEADKPREKKWRLLILEDSGELMVPDAKTQTGQGLSRLLNVVDGLIGQGLRIMVLVTTNEVLKKLHPAVARPGRCAARVEFGEFSRSEGKAWLKAHQYDLSQKDPITGTTISLAELFSNLHEADQQIIGESKPLSVGFTS